MQNSVPTFLSWVLAMGISAIPSLLDGQEFDLLTANCLLGYENDDYPQLCAEVWPQLKEEVTQAKRLWQSRNARKLNQLQNACETRLLRAYDRDLTKIQEAKQQALEWRSAYKAQLLREPNRHDLIDCPAYAKDFAAGNEKIDIQQSLVDTTRDGPARSVKWPNP